MLIGTAHGRIVIELLEAAGPQTIPRFVRLIQEAEPELGHRPSDARLTFNVTKPHVEITMAESAEKAGLQLALEIDAEALGLHQRRVMDPGEAMDLMQEEILPFYIRHRLDGEINSKLETWINQWYVARDASFLVGTSRKEINEALGYVYKTGLSSQPVSRGTVVLKPISPFVVSSGLTIILTDIPSRTGLWMVIGRVVEGMEIADSISARPLIPPSRASNQFTPVEPVVIETLRFTCVGGGSDNQKETRK
ncbi:MAG: hypothetical protein HC897_08760 [Thermoanaerobaculia bacterium]|nr:hypothetical protein [Thermoanaerobaculia bacterium]